MTLSKNELQDPDSQLSLHTYYSFQAKMLSLLLDP